MSEPASTPLTEQCSAKKQKASSVRHTRAIQRDRTTRPLVQPPDAEVTARLTALIHPLTLAHVGHYYDLGLRQRLLTLPVVLALVLSMIWRQIDSVRSAVLLLEREGFLWTSPIRVSHQALNQRLRTLPAALFRQVLFDLLPLLHGRWRERTRPLPPEVAWATERYRAVLAVDGSTLDALLKKVGLLAERVDTPLAGRMTALLHVGSRLPAHLWYEPDARAHDQRAWDQILAVLPAGALLLFDLGYASFARFAQLTAAHVTFVTRAKSNLACTVSTALRHTSAVHDDLVWVGSGADRQQLRLISVLHQGIWQRYLTNELDPALLPVLYAVPLYYQRWRMEEAYALVKRLLGLAYFWCGAENAVQLQLYATWILYAVLLDLGDAVAATLDQPLAAISLARLYRYLYFFTTAYQAGTATDVVAYMAAEAPALGILKPPRSRAPAPSLFHQLALTLAHDP
jgi:Transposase DDE domain